jgi:uncharacterized protein with HEPN domain
MRRAAEFLLHVTDGRTLDDYCVDEVLRTLVERKFEIIGEALNRLIKSDPSAAEQIPESRQIISFRNLLIHGYDVIDEEVVWKIVRQDLPILKSRVEALLTARNPLDESAPQSN